ncbi:polysaccharide biosynthesis protein [Sphingomonas sp. RG327]|uniref:Polysaccharide biosynthesis protein n=1 Tax=Sphingomonas anseongensis TaxID=2908207 RepID=A0ABT0RCQ4_9SPHN|nr:polysaccharide biosynthesis protein [Sphingomonas anseongensis]
MIKGQKLSGDLIRLLPKLSRRKKRAIVVGYDVAAMVIALWAAFLTRFGDLYVPTGRSVIVAAVVAVLAGLAALYQFGVYHLVLRYFDLRVVTRLLSAAGLSALAWVTTVYFLHAHISYAHRTFLVPRSVAFIYFGFLFVALFMGRFMMSTLLAGTEHEPRSKADARKIIIYGANVAAIRLAESVRTSTKYRLIAFIDPDPAVNGQMVSGVPIHSPDALADLAASNDVKEVFLAMPKATRSERLAAIDHVRNLGLEVKTVPAPEEIVSGRFTVTDVRPIDVSDLLRREPVEPLQELIREAVRGNSILITGAGGSIGSEICRQVFGESPSKVVLLDHSEFALYQIHDELLEMSEALPPKERPELVAVVGSMLNEKFVRQIIDDHSVDTLYHAAAYKHVPLLEDNEVVGVENNVFGTLSVVRAAAGSRLARFTMISTDKAVRPTSLMGASKRIAELVVQAFAAEPNCKTRFGIVRFGNVLDSSGSVVQRFRRQIQAGGPVTITHKDVTRFFMSIPEATQLVLQAGAMASKGEVFVLDMGEPIRIADLARHMINLSGMSVRDDDNPDGDIELSYVGLRPGEKLHEELFVNGETLPTIHPRIRMGQERILLQAELDKVLRSLRATIEKSDRGKLRQVIDDCLSSEKHPRDRAKAATLEAQGYRKRRGANSPTSS